MTQGPTAGAQIPQWSSVVHVLKSEPMLEVELRVLKVLLWGLVPPLAAVTFTTPQSVLLATDDRPLKGGKLHFTSKLLSLQ